MHQQPPQTPLFATTSAAKSSQVSGVSRCVVYWVTADVTVLLSCLGLRPASGQAHMLRSVPDVLLPDTAPPEGKQRGRKQATGNRETAIEPDSSPTARALLALELLQGSPGITADRLA